MTILFILVPVSLLLGLIGIAAFLWSLSKGQYSDMTGAAERILCEDFDASPNHDPADLKEL